MMIIDHDENDVSATDNRKDCYDGDRGKDKNKVDNANVNDVDWLSPLLHSIYNGQFINDVGNDDITLINPPGWLSGEHVGLMTWWL